MSTHFQVSQLLVISLYSITESVPDSLFDGKSPHSFNDISEGADLLVRSWVDEWVCLGVYKEYSDTFPSLWQINL